MVNEFWEGIAAFLAMSEARQIAPIKKLISPYRQYKYRKGPHHTTFGIYIVGIMILIGHTPINTTIPIT